MYRNTGNFTFATIDYYYENIFGRLDDPVMPRMTALIDPYEYRDRLIMPKLIISSTGDEFFMPDDRIGYSLAPALRTLRCLPAPSSGYPLKVITISKIYLSPNIFVCWQMQNIAQFSTEYRIRILFSVCDRSLLPLSRVGMTHHFRFDITNDL